MAETTSHKRTSIAQLIFIPALISLAVTIIRLIGERQHWPTALFNPDAGGAGSIIGITWLAPIFGIYFAMKLSDSGEGPEDRGRAVRLAIAGLVLFAGGGVLALNQKLNFPGKIVIALLLMLVAVGLQYAGWPKLFKTLLAYGYAARIPVAILMYFAIRGNWGTHYDVVPPGFPADTAFWPKYLQIAFVPQMVLWIAFTIITGALTGSIVAAVKRRSQPTTQAARA
jgi:hypothetical protein